MTPILKVLNRCLVVEFYKQNSAFFGLVFLIFFGFIKSSEHVAIGSFLVANPSSLLYLYLLCIAYGIKVILFLLPAINKEENMFLVSFYLLTSREKFIASTITSILLLIPVGAYMVFLITLALYLSFYISIIALLAGFAILVIALSILILRQLNHLPHEITFITFRFFNKIIRPPYIFFIEYLLRNDLVLLSLTKLYACLVIIGASLLYATDTFDLRVLATGVLLAFVGNFSILHKYVWFNYHKLTITWNLPLSFLKMLIQLLLTFSIVLIPEFAILIRYYPLRPDLLDIVGILLYGLSLSFLIYGLLLKKHVDLSQFVVVVFWLVVASTFLILFSIHPMVLACINFFISITLIYLRYDKFEYVEKTQ